MADKYPSFAVLLAAGERSGVDFRVRFARAGPRFAIVAPHGGGIEPGTSELAEAIAGEGHCFYAFEGLKRSGNADLHLTSTRFDEPRCAELIRGCESVLTVHGASIEASGESVFVGGLDQQLGLRIGAALQARGFDVRSPADSRLQGTELANLCNRGKSGRGVQLELTLGVRQLLFRALTRAGRRQRTERFAAFVAAVAQALDASLAHCDASPTNAASLAANHSSPSSVRTSK